MLLDARGLPDGHVIDTDVCIVGAGVAGITLAREFIGQQFNVCVLESGGLKAESETQALCVGKTVGHPYYPLDTARVRQFGGSSPRWRLDFGGGRQGGRLRPLDEIDFEERDWVPYSGWPFTRGHLSPYYERAQTVCKAGPLAYDVESWQLDNGLRPLPLPPHRVRTSIYQGIDREVFAIDYRPEVERAGNVSVYLHANALELTTTEDARSVVRVEGACLNGVRFAARAKLFILAAGGIETPRLLLLSNRRYPTGLGNQHDLVGRFFMEHPHLWSGLYVPSDRRIFAQAGLYRTHMVNGVPVVGQLTIPEDVLRRERMLNYSVYLVPGVRSTGQRAVTEGKAAVAAACSALWHGDIAELNRHLSTLFPVANDFAFAVHAKTTRVLNRVFGLKRPVVFLLNHMAEQVPNPDSRVTLTQERDPLGQNRVQLDWRLSPIDIRSMVRAQEIIDEELRAAGLGRLEIELHGDTPPPHLHGGWHHMGTTRMHRDPRRGVVDPDCRVHGVSNVFIAGASVFPTGGCANPVLTTVALTLRLGDHVKRLMA